MTCKSALSELEIAVPSKNAVSANIKHSRLPLMKHPISGQSTTVVKGNLYLHMFDTVDTAFSKL